MRCGWIGKVEPREAPHHSPIVGSSLKRTLGRRLIRGAAQRRMLGLTQSLRCVAARLGQAGPNLHGTRAMKRLVRRTGGIQMAGHGPAGSHPAGR